MTSRGPKAEAGGCRAGPVLSVGGLGCRHGTGSAVLGGPGSGRRRAAGSSRAARLWVGRDGQPREDEGAHMMEKKSATSFFLPQMPLALSCRVSLDCRTPLPCRLECAQLSAQQPAAGRKVGRRPWKLSEDPNSIFCRRHDDYLTEYRPFAATVHTQHPFPFAPATLIHSPPSAACTASICSRLPSKADPAPIRPHLVWAHADVGPRRRLPQRYAPTREPAGILLKRL